MQRKDLVLVVSLGIAFSSLDFACNSHLESRDLKKPIPQCPSLQRDELIQFQDYKTYLYLGSAFTSAIAAGSLLLKNKAETSYQR